MPEHKYEKSLREMGTAMKVVLESPKTFFLQGGRTITLQAFYVKRIIIAPDTKEVKIFCSEFGTAFTLIGPADWDYDAVFNLEDIEKRIKLVCDSSQGPNFSF